MAWLPDGEKNEDIFIRFGANHERDGHTQTDRHTHYDGIGRAYASHRAAKMKIYLFKHVTVHIEHGRQTAICLFVSTEYTNVPDGRTDKRTDTAQRHRLRLCVASRGKN